MDPCCLRPLCNRSRSVVPRATLHSRSFFRLQHHIARDHLNAGAGHIISLGADARASSSERLADGGRRDRGEAPRGGRGGARGARPRGRCVGGSRRRRGAAEGEGEGRGGPIPRGGFALGGPARGSAARGGGAHVRRSAPSRGRRTRRGQQDRLAGIRARSGDGRQGASVGPAADTFLRRLLCRVRACDPAAGPSHEGAALRC